MALQRIQRALAVGLVALIGLLVLKFFVADVYRVSSGSMRPTIFGGPPRPGEATFTEWLLVAYERDPELERFDLVVVDREGGPVVKRVVGLPNETLRIFDGDVLIDGKRLPRDAPRPRPPVVFDSFLLPVEDYFHFRRDEGGPWTRDEDVWTLEARDVAPGSYAGMMGYHPELRDDYLDQNGRRVVGRRTINDAILECDFSIERQGGCLRFQLLEKADTFEVRVVAREGEHPGPSTSHLVELVHGSVSSRQNARSDEVFQRVDVDLELGRWYRLRFANVDNHLTAALPELGIELRHSYERNELYPGTAQGGDQNVGQRVTFGGEQLRARFRSIRILRDLHYSSTPELDGYGITSAAPIGPGEVFLLGDNSSSSQDSRFFGPVSIRDLVGRPTHVVWPPGRLRSLEHR